MEKLLTRTLTIVACVFVMTNAHNVVELIGSAADITHENPEAVTFVVTTGIMLVTLIRVLASFSAPRHRAPSIERRGTATRRELVEDRDAAELERFARHEAAHTLIAYLLDGTHLTANIHRVADRAGQATYRNVPGRTSYDDAYDDLVIGVAGQTIDNLNGHFDIAATADMRSQQMRMMTILSIGKTPSRHTGPLTVEALISATRAEAERLLTDHPAALERITQALLDKRELEDHEIRALATDSYQSDASCGIAPEPHHHARIAEGHPS